METKTTKINLTEVEIKDLNGVVYKIDGLPREIGNIIFTEAATIEVSDLARTLHAGNEAEVNKQELAEIVHIVATSSYYRPFAQTQIIDYLKDKLMTFKPKEETQNG